MSESPMSPNWERVNPKQSLVFVLAIAIIGFFFVGPFISLLVAVPFYEGSLMDMINAMSNPLSFPGIRNAMMLVQGMNTFLAFIVAPYLYSRYFLKLTNKDLFGKEAPPPIITLLVFIIVIVFMVANSIFIEWNQNVELPESLSGFERWAKTFENKAQEITLFFTRFDGISEFLVGLLVIAIIPAVGEELVFRGLVQNHIQIITKNIHVAIWASAFLFSFFHFQFYGFVPRMFLGALFGYMYVWSGNIIYPIIGHFINNGFTLLMVYFYHTGAVEFDIESTESVPITNVLVSMVVCSVLLYLFQSYFRKKKLNEQLEVDLQN